MEKVEVSYKKEEKGKAEMIVHGSVSDVLSAIADMATHYALGIGIPLDELHQILDILIDDTYADATLDKELMSKAIKGMDKFMDEKFTADIKAELKNEALKNMKESV